MKKFIEDNALRIAWLTAVVATAGSLYFSEIADYAPCMLCWYQRISMYPLVILFFVALRDTRARAVVASYTLPLIVVGAAVSVYHNLLYYNVLPESEASCRFGVSCTTKYIEWAGFVTIPLLSLIAFCAIGALVLVSARRQNIADR